ncbi:PREDICTED: acyl-coenzyme A thioesterase 13-like [Polistes dominula]|uniref:Acyl-coenzyme A thioesterase 13-like n=1 Tax=Polistes dominula TaxID=743375 RepID=A0ABM1IY22_POLDO|nr:PREDICTED: acyl-coenzyme A thioesterase 13-like [Polistes dominula]
MTRGTELIKSVIERISTSSGFGRCMKNVRILSAGDGNCKAEFTVSDEHLNLGGSLHGGFTATIIDCVSTYALMTYKTGAPGVSVNMNISYMKPAFPGEVVEVDAKTIRAGRTLAYLTVDLTKNNGKDIIANGNHVKFIL